MTMGVYLILAAVSLTALGVQNVGRGHAEMTRLCGYRSIPVPGQTEPV